MSPKLRVSGRGRSLRKPNRITCTTSWRRRSFRKNILTKWPTGSFMRGKAGTATQLLRRAVSRCFLKQRRREALISQGEGEVPGTMVAALKQKFLAGSSRKDGVRLRGNLFIQRSCNTANRCAALNMRRYMNSDHDPLGGSLWETPK